MQRTDRFSNVRSQSRDIDAGLQRYMQTIYNRMAMGVLVTALTAWGVSSVPDLMYMLLGTPVKYLIIFGPLAILWFGFNPATMSANKLMVSFFGISILYGITFSAIALIADVGTIARAFFVASAMFAGLSIFGYTTRKNLDALGTFAIMGIMGIFFASLGLMVASMFGIQTSMMQNVIAGVGIVAFSGITAWQTQQMKELYNSSFSEEFTSRISWAAALNLYVSFIALFQYIFHFMNQR